MSQYKDGFFRSYFSDKKRLLSLVNLLLNTDLKNADDLVINTLPGVFFGKIKNDLSCIVEDKFLVIMEQQSTPNENMPVRMLFYVAELLKNYILPIKRHIYREKLIKLVKPRFFVLYNGKKREPPRREMRLSDAFDGDKNLELIVTLINIHSEENAEFVRKSEYLLNYVKFVQYVGEYAKATGDIEKAIYLAIKRCKDEGRMTDYLKEHEGELGMTYALEWDEDEAKLAWAEEREEAIMEAKMEARKEAQKEAKKEAKRAREDGVREGVTSMITELLKAGQSVEFISKISKFPKEKVLELGKLHNVL